MKLTPPGIWQARTVYTILINQAYIGKAFYGKTHSLSPMVSARQDRVAWIEVPIEPIITPELFQRTQDAMQRGKELSWSRGQEKHHYLLVAPGAKLLICGRCQKAMRGVTDQVGRHHYRCPSYVDHTVPRAKVCRGSIWADALNAQVWNRLTAFLQDPHRLVEHLQRQFDSTDARADDLYQHIRYLDQQLAPLATKLKRWDDTYASGAISVYDLKEKRLELALDERELLKDKQETQGQLDAVHASLNELDAVLDKLFDVYVQWSGDDFTQLTQSFATVLQERRGEIQERLDQASIAERQRLLVAFHITVIWNPGDTHMPVEIRGAVDIEPSETANMAFPIQTQTNFAGVLMLDSEGYVS